MLYGVGTCVIESAALGIPSMVLLMDTKEICDNQAYWYFDTKHYCTRITVEQKNDFNINYTSIADSVNSILAKNGKKLGGGYKCYEYYKKNHGSIDKLAMFFRENN